MNLLFTLLIFIVVAALAIGIVRMIPLPAPFQNIAVILVCLILLLYLVGMFTGHSPLVFPVH